MQFKACGGKCSGQLKIKGAQKCAALKWEESMGFKILAINPGSTSTKIALYEDEKELFTETLTHDIVELEKYEHVQDQFLMRKKVVEAALETRGLDVLELAAVVGRGGMLPPVKSGAYEVNEVMLDVLKNRPALEHASNLGAIIAYEIASRIGVKAYIYDSVRVDELQDIARISGMPVIPRTSTVHALNARAMAMKAAASYNKRYQDVNCIVAHLGGGISLSVHSKGQMIDIISDDEGPFSPERAGRVPCKQLIDLCYSGDYDKRTAHKMLRGNGGLKAYLGTHDAREVEKRIADGDDEAKRVYEAMAYQVAKGIGELATVVDGEVDYIVLTGGIAYSKMLTDWIIKRVQFIAPIALLPGENEMESLAGGTLRVLRGEETAHIFEL
jgi:butyrate kinase